MSRILSWITLVCLVVGGAGRQASAGTIATTLENWADNPIDTGLDNMGGDKVFTYLGSENLTGDELVTVVFNEDQGIYSISLSGDLPNAFAFEYSVAITSGDHVFKQLDADATVPLTEIDVDKWFYDSDGFLVESLHVDDGEPESTPIGDYGNWLRTVVVVSSPNGEGAITSLSDTYHQTPAVPEPGTFVLAGLGACGAFVLSQARRRKGRRG